MTTAALLRAAAAQLAAAGIENPRLEARLLLQHVREHALPQAGDEEIVARLQRLLVRRTGREPLAYVLGRKEFWSLDFEVGPGALVPRPDTETLIEEALKAFPDRTAALRIADLGTGSGCLLVAALTLYPGATGTGVDASTEALAWARRNVARHGVGDRATLLEGGWTAAAGAQFDLIFSNPPYLAAAEMAAVAPELAYEPQTALAAGPDGLEAYRALGPAIGAILAPSGLALIEIGAGQGGPASAALAQGGLEILGLTPDLSGIPRCIAARAGSESAAWAPQKTVGKRELRG